MSLVWIAGPLSGVLVQPIVGMLSDSSKSRFGKRRPFMVGGTIFTILSLFLLSWSIDIVKGLFGWAVDNLLVLTQVFAVLMVYMLDFSIGTGKPFFFIRSVKINQFSLLTVEIFAHKSKQVLAQS